MGVKIRKICGKYNLVIDHHGKRKKKVIGTDLEFARTIKGEVEEKLKRGDFGLLNESEAKTECTFQQYADKWLDEYDRKSVV